MYEMGKAEIVAVVKVLKSKQFMRYRGGEGGYTEKFEHELCTKFNIPHALMVNSGTNASICALAAMGIGPGAGIYMGGQRHGPADGWRSSSDGRHQ